MLLEHVYDHLYCSLMRRLKMMLERLSDENVISGKDLASGEPVALVNLRRVCNMELFSPMRSACRCGEQTRIQKVRGRAHHDGVFRRRVLPKVINQANCVVVRGIDQWSGVEWLHSGGQMGIKPQ